MARNPNPPTRSEEAYSQWTKIKAYCPICNELITRSYCRNCGIPNNNNGYFICEDKLFRFGPPRFRPNDIIGEYQLCGKCGAPNPYNVNFCKSCGGDITLCAKDKNGHGWVDLGLSVLWSAKTIEGLYKWNHSQIQFDTQSDMSDYLRIDIENKDIATIKWGAKWRTPTKEEFEELVTKCKWEKCLDATSKKHALKATGPNGNSITLLVTGHAGCSCERLRWESALYNPENIYSECSFWTSSEDLDRPNRCAYSFSFIGYDGFAGREMTAKECKQWSFDLKRHSLFSPIDESVEQMCQRLEKERKERIQEQHILSKMGDDSRERIENEKKAQERRSSLWLETPIEFIYDTKDLRKITFRRTPKSRGLAIRPVADKKWKGKL